MKRTPWLSARIAGPSVALELVEKSNAAGRRTAMTLIVNSDELSCVAPSHPSDSRDGTEEKQGRRMQVWCSQAIGEVISTEAKRDKRTRPPSNETSTNQEQDLISAGHLEGFRTWPLTDAKSLFRVLQTSREEAHAKYEDYTKRKGNIRDPEHVHTPISRAVRLQKRVPESAQDQDRQIRKDMGA
jgi:hypothetical protein